MPLEFHAVGIPRCAQCGVIPMAIFKMDLVPEFNDGRAGRLYARIYCSRKCLFKWCAAKVSKDAPTGE